MTPLAFDQLTRREKVRYTWESGSYLLTFFQNMIFHTLYLVDGFFVEISSDANTGEAVEISSFKNCNDKLDSYIRNINLAELV
jgi:hypothetical protein